MRDRLAAESDEQREARLQQMSDTQRERIAAETIEQRQVRLQNISERQQGLRSGEQTPQLFKQRSVQVHILYFI